MQPLLLKKNRPSYNKKLYVRKMSDKLECDLELFFNHIFVFECKWLEYVSSLP